jgi:16S rRNA (guanine527-N7)-methyltransferase
MSPEERHGRERFPSGSHPADSLLPGSVRGRIAELCRLHRLPAGAAGQLDGLLGLLAQDDRAPTTVRSPGDAVETHLADSLSALSQPLVGPALSVLDLGAGAGFPGLPLAIALPDARVRLLDATRRKCDYLVDVVASLELANAEVVCSRAETWKEGFGAHDLVLARAVSSQPVVLEYAAPLLAVGGALVEWRGARDPTGERDGAAASRRLGLRLVEVLHVVPFPGALNRHLHVFVKETPTPQGFPRRPGLARKRPLLATSSPRTVA